MGARRKRKNKGKYGWKNKSKKAKQLPKPSMEKTDETFVYIWSSRTSDSGRASLKLPGGVYISFRSRDPEYKVKVTSPVYPVRLDDDVGEEGRPPDTTLKIPAKLLNEDDILHWFQNFKDQQKIFLVQNQSCQVIYNALREGGGNVCEPLYWTPLRLERYVRKFCRQPKQNLFGDMFSLEWYSEMDGLSKILFFLMLILGGVLILMAASRIPPQESDTWTCLNDYEPCRQYVERFFKGDNSSMQNMLKENSGPIFQFILGIGVIFICTRFSTENLVALVLRKKGKKTDSDDEDEDDDDDDDDDVCDGDEVDDEDDGNFSEMIDESSDPKATTDKPNGKIVIYVRD